MEQILEAQSRAEASRVRERETDWNALTLQNVQRLGGVALARELFDQIWACRTEARHCCVIGKEPNVSPDPEGEYRDAISVLTLALPGIVTCRPSVRVNEVGDFHLTSSGSHLQTHDTFRLYVRASTATRKRQSEEVAHRLVIDSMKILDEETELPLYSVLVCPKITERTAQQFWWQARLGRTPRVIPFDEFAYQDLVQLLDYRSMEADVKPILDWILAEAAEVRTGKKWLSRIKDVVSHLYNCDAKPLNLKDVPRRS